MSIKPLIGLNADYQEGTGGKSSFSFLASGYCQHIQRAGGIPIVLPPLNNKDDIESALNMVNGFVLVGGKDIDSHNEGFVRNPSTRLMAEKRETFDRELVDSLAKRRMPLFAIGAGLQLLNVLQGGSLHYHIPEDLPSALPHSDSQDRGHRHGLEVVPGTLMEKVYGDGEVRVNSRHHMAIDEVATDFKVSAICPDGVIEAIECQRDDWFVLGTQFHPQAQTASALDGRLFEEFLDAVKNSSRVFEPQLVA